MGLCGHAVASQLLFLIGSVAFACNGVGAARTRFGIQSSVAQIRAWPSGPFGASTSDAPCTGFPVVLDGGGGEGSQGFAQLASAALNQDVRDSALVRHTKSAMMVARGLR